MIKKLQNRFIRIAVISLTVAMVLVVGIVNLANWVSVRKDLYDTLNLLIRSDETGVSEEKEPGQFPAVEQAQVAEQVQAAAQQAAAAEETSQPKMRPPSRYFRNMMAESRWYSAIVSEDGTVERPKMSRWESSDEDTLKELIRHIAADGRTEGFYQDYLFRVRDLGGGLREVVTLNCETRLAAVRTLVLFSAIVCACGILLALLTVILASRKAIEPTIRNMEQQKQFITNASHELKTPLTVISTNMELLQMENGDNPWVKSTRKQTAAMRHLVDELVYLSRMEEEHPNLEMTAFDPGRLLEETAEPFQAMAEFNGVTMTVKAQKKLRMTGDRASVQRLMSTLCDNAVKYAAGGPITAGIGREGKYIVLRVSNPVEEPLTKQQCEQLFDRFYRTDQSRSKEKKSGYGIGLAIAAAIAEKHGGRISAAMEEGRLVITCMLARETKP